MSCLRKIILEENICPTMAFGVLGLFVAAMLDPIWFADRMAGLSLVPEPLWWLLGAIVSFYFGARHQSKSFEIRAKDIQKQAETIAQRIQTNAVNPLGQSTKMPL